MQRYVQRQRAPRLMGIRLLTAITWWRAPFSSNNGDSLIHTLLFPTKC